MQNEIKNLRRKQSKRLGAARVSTTRPHFFSLPRDPSRECAAVWIAFQHDRVESKIEEVRVKPVFAAAYVLYRTTELHIHKPVLASALLMSSSYTVQANALLIAFLPIRSPKPSSKLRQPLSRIIAFPAEKEF